MVSASEMISSLNDLKSAAQRLEAANASEEEIPEEYSNGLTTLASSLNRLFEEEDSKAILSEVCATEIHHIPQSAAALHAQLVGKNQLATEVADELAQN